MFHLLLLVYVMILDKNYLKISKEDDIEKINYAGRQLGWAGADPTVISRNRLDFSD